MKILLVSMSAMAETSGPSSRSKLLVEEFKNAGMEVATCMAEDVNYKKIDGIRNYYLDIPMPFGLPKPIASRTFPIAQKLGITSKKTVKSFDQVLQFTGNLDYKYLKKSALSIRNAIWEFKPDAVYSEFNISGIIAAKKENIPLYVSVSFPTQHEYAHDEKLSKGLNKLLGELELPTVESALQLFKWADKAFCPSIPELEPIKGENIFFCGTLKNIDTNVETKENAPRNKILVYMGNGTISAPKMLEVVRGAFEGGKYDVYVASSYLKEENFGNIHVAPRWDFNTLLDESVLFINHGGQNSVVDGLLHGVPQIIVPGKVFERYYNADRVASRNAGILVSTQDFNSEFIKDTAEKIINSDEMSNAARDLGIKLRDAGGVKKIVEMIKGTSD